jgi:hypothetical protein
MDPKDLRYGAASAAASAVAMTTLLVANEGQQEGPHLPVPAHSVPAGRDGPLTPVLRKRAGNEGHHQAVV